MCHWIHIVKIIMWINCILWFFFYWLYCSLWASWL